MAILIVVDSPDRWPLRVPGVEVVSGRRYLTDPRFSEERGTVVFNLSRSYAYQRMGYYVSLLAEARGHRAQPSVATLQDIRHQTITRLVSEELSDLMAKALSPIQSDEFTLSIYFGQPLAKRYRRLAAALFGQFQAPLLRARFARRNGQWVLQQLGPIAAKDVPVSHRDFVVEAAERYFSNRRWSPPRRKQPRCHLAILHDPEEEDAPSDEGALERFERAAHRLGIATERIDRHDYGRLAEFDALFLRETTYVNHHTYRFARRAAAEGLVVVDDPQSIIRCTNKVYLAELLERYDVPRPRTLIVHRDNRGSVARELGLPCVLKQPDSAFSRGVVKVEDEASLQAELDRLLEDSELVVAQEWLPTEYDWRVGIFGGRPLYVCRYFMAPKHWQIAKREAGRGTRYGRVETIAVEDAPRRVVRAALRAARPIGDGLYGVDLKQSQRGRVHVIEVNDNPTIESGVEDRVLGAELYRRLAEGFLERVERRLRGGGDR